MSLPPFHQTVINQQPSSSTIPASSVEVLAGLRLHQNHPGIQAFGLGALGNLATAEDNCAATGHGMVGMGWLLLDEKMPEILESGKKYAKKNDATMMKNDIFLGSSGLFQVSSVRLVSSITADEPLLPGDSEGRSH
jgi:hypothetical protein